jgi:hypothetical protein
MECLGKVPADVQVSGAQIVMAAARELTSGLEGPRGRTTRRAPYVPVKVAMAWERTVMCDTQPAYVRGYAWVRLVKYWASMRFDDLKWLDPAKVNLRAQGLFLTLERTKVIAWLMPNNRSLAPKMSNLPRNQ